MRLWEMAEAYDRTLLEGEASYIEQLKEEHATGEKTTGWFERTHARAERHHWDIVMPANPNILNLAAWLTDRVVRSRMMTGNAPDVPEVNDAVLRKILDNTTDLINGMTEE